ncbi:Flp pilus assembly protein CpaB [Aliivibrio kagoshimensis]|uniref:Flp pilus assembly protein CpaB n=1 Tax=Aliivibrio kagoshimensis TaxID=2910230 RepID=UPI003D0B2A7A
MSKSHIALLFLVSVVLGLAAVFVAQKWISGQIQPTEEVEVVIRKPIIIAAIDIPSGTVIEDKHLKPKLIEEDWLSDNQFTDTEEILGKVLANHIYQDEIISRQRVLSTGDGATLAALIPKSKRAVTIRVNDVIGVAGFLLPGNKVDVLNTVNRNKRVTTTTVLKDIRVLAVDQSAKTDANKPVIVRAVTLEVTPLQAEKLLTAKGKGEIQLALRNPFEPEKEKVVRRRIVTPTVTIIKGTDKTSIKVKE